MDQEGPWPFGEDFVTRVREELAQYETQTWGELQGRGSHSLEIDGNLTKAARARAQELDLEGELFSLRIGGAQRIIGVRDRRVLHLLWDDRWHEVAESKQPKDNRPDTRLMPVRIKARLAEKVRGAAGRDVDGWVAEALERKLRQKEA